MMSGYKKPPKDTQFKKGTSGNPKGRPKGKKNKTIADILEKELKSELKLKDGSSLSKREAAVKNFSNNALQTKKLHESVRALEVISKFENTDKDVELAKDFLERMLKENYIDINDAQDFARKRKDPRFNFPKAIHKLDNRTRAKDISAWEAVKQVENLSMVHNYIEKIDSLEVLFHCVQDELKFWDYVETQVLEELDINQEEQDDIISILEEARVFAKPSKNILHILSKFLYTERSNLRYLLFTERDKLMNMSFYQSNEKEFFDNYRVNEALKKAKGFTHKQLKEAHGSLTDMYDNFTNLQYNGELMEIRDQLEDTVTEEILTWFQRNNKKTREVRDVLEEIVEKYG
jgi:hypothetical protein